MRPVLNNVKLVKLITFKMTLVHVHQIFLFSTKQQENVKFLNVNQVKNGIINLKNVCLLIKLAKKINSITLLKVNV